MKSIWILILSIAFFCLLRGQSPEEEMADPDQIRALIERFELIQIRENRPVSDLTVFEAYTEAKALEEEIVQLFREIRAADLSLIQGLTLHESLEATLTPLSQRQQVDATILNSTARSAEDVKRYQEELGVVLRETDAIVENARNLLNQFRSPPPSSPGSPPEENPVFSSDQAFDMSQLMEMMEQMEQLGQQISEGMQDAEIDLEAALVEIKRADEKVDSIRVELQIKIRRLTQSMETEEVKELERTGELEVAESREEHLKDLSQKIESAEHVVSGVVEDLRAMRDVSEGRVEAAETIVRELSEALAAVEEADAAVPEPQRESVGPHTAEAVERVLAARQSMESVASDLAALEMMQQGGMGMGMGMGMGSGMGSGSGSGMGSGSGSGTGRGSAIAQQQALGNLARSSSGRWVNLTEQMRGRNLNAPASEVPPSDRPELWSGIGDLRNAPSSRKIPSAARQGTDWFFVDGWYVLSRYDNPGRANIQKVYPPESILDLNARYLSEDGKPMRWEYENFAPPVMIPHPPEEWKIYYFYTELFAEEEMEVWLAIGSDDRSDLWINDLPVWHSSNEHKPWRPDEGFRKVVLRQGRNKILARLENGQLGLGLSVFVKVEPQR